MDDVVAEQGDLDPFRAQVGRNLPCLGQDDGHEQRERWQGVEKYVPEHDPFVIRERAGHGVWAAEYLMGVSVDSVVV